MEDLLCRLICGRGWFRLAHRYSQLDHLPRGFGAITFCAIALIAQCVWQPNAFAIIGKNSSLNIPAKSGHMLYAGQCVVVGRPSPQVEFSKFIIPVELGQTVAILCKKGDIRDGLWSQNNGDMWPREQIAKAKTSWQGNIREVQVEACCHIYRLGISSVLPFRNEIEGVINSFFDSDVTQRYVSPGLPLFCIVGSPPLIISEFCRARSGYSGYEQQPKIRISPMFFGCIGIAFLTIGLWHGYFAAWRRGPLYRVSCIGLFIAGWLILAFCDVVADFAENAAGFFGFYGVSATRYSGTKYVHVLSIVVPKLKLGDVQRHVFGADLMIGADNTALHQRPKTLNCVGVDRADNVLVFAVVNHFMRERSRQIDVAGPSIRSQQANLVGNGFPDKLGYACAINAFQNASDDFALALDCADNADLTGARAAPYRRYAYPSVYFCLSRRCRFRPLQRYRPTCRGGVH